MLLKVSKYLIVALLGGVTVCSGSYLQRLHESYNDVGSNYEDPTAATICVVNFTFTGKTGKV